MIYSALLWLLLPFALLRLLWRSRRDVRYRQRLAERFGRVPVRPEGPLIWLHAVSVGEVLACEPLVAALRAACPAYRWHFTTTTPTGAALVRERFGDAVTHSYLPFDLDWCVRLFLRRLRPAFGLILETEIWPNLFHACHSRGIDICLINARLSDRSLRRYVRLRGLASATLRHTALIAAQTEPDAQRFIRLGAPAGRVAVTGNLKYDRRIAADVRQEAQRWRARWGESRPVWVAGSVHEGECRALLSAFSELRARHTDLLLCLAPRHPERAPQWEREAGALGLNPCLYSTASESIDDCSLLIVDALGVLDRFYHAADVAFVGGSLNERGGHNPIEALAAGVPVAHGPHVWNFADVYRSLDALGASRTVADADALAHIIGTWLDDPAARSMAAQAGRDALNARRGAADRTLALLKARGILD